MKNVLGFICVMLSVFAALFGHVGQAQSTAIDILDATGGIMIVGEFSADNPSYSIPIHHDFTLFNGQTFVALPGLAEELSFHLGPSAQSSTGVVDGVDFRVLITDIRDEKIPTNVVFESELFTMGPTLGNSGTPIEAGVVTVNIGSIDLVDGATYAWILDFVTGADGIEGYTGTRLYYRSTPLKPDVYPDGNYVGMKFDLELNGPISAWYDAPDSDMLFRLSFSEGGIPNPEPMIIREFEYRLPIPEPSSILLMGAGLIGLVGFRKKFKV